MSEHITHEKEHDRKRRLLEGYLNSQADDNTMIYQLDFKSDLKTDPGMVLIRFVTEYAMSEDEFDDFIEKLES